MDMNEIFLKSPNVCRSGGDGSAACAAAAVSRKQKLYSSFFLYVYSMYIGAELSRNRRENILYTKVLRALLLTGSIHK